LLTTTRECDLSRKHWHCPNFSFFLIQRLANSKQKEQPLFIPYFFFLNIKIQIAANVFSFTSGLYGWGGCCFFAHSTIELCPHNFHRTLASQVLENNNVRRCFSVYICVYDYDQRKEEIERMILSVWFVWYCTCFNADFESDFFLW